MGQTGAVRYRCVGWLAAAFAGALLAGGASCGGPPDRSAGTAASTSAASAPTASAPAASAAPPASAPPCADRPSGSSLLARLRAGGQVIYIRHTATKLEQDDPTPNLADPATQRNLSDLGREQARRLGRATQRLGVPVGEVLVSPYARTQQTGELAFGVGRPRQSPDLLNEAFPGADVDELARALRRLLSTPPPSGLNTVLVSHGFNVRRATGVTLEEGGSAVFRPDGPDRYCLLTTLTIGQWEALGRHG